MPSACFFQWKGILALILALFSHALIYIECQRKCTNVSVITFNALPSLISGIFLSTISWFLENPNINLFSNKSILAIFYLGDFSGVFGVPMAEKIQKMLSNLGYGSRRYIESTIKKGNVFVNGKKAIIGQYLDQKNVEEVFMNKEKIIFEQNKKLKVIIYNKPIGEICTRNDPKKRLTVFNKLPILKLSRWVCIGRLDINTKGLLLFTNNGKLANQLMHPKNQIEREYFIRVFGKINKNTIDVLKKGVKVQNNYFAFKSIELISNNKNKNKWFKGVLCEGKNREIRLIFNAVQCQVSKLIRVRYGNIFLPKNLKEGQCKKLNFKLLNSLFESPVKAKTINQYLGDKYIVKSSIGHVRDLLKNQPKKIKKTKNSFFEHHEKKLLIQQMGINPYENWNVEYHILPGRVQSVAVRIITEREDEIKNFISKEYWKLNVSFISFEKKNILMEVTHYKNKILTLHDEKEVNLIIEKLKNQSFFVTDRKEKILYRKPPAPFITSTLQQASSLHLGFSVKKTMFLAQKLYEEGYITYMRTDSFFLSDYAIKKVRSYIKNYYGINFLPETPNIYLNKKNSQEAHEAIRPTDIEITDINQNKMNSDSIKLYKLIWNQFVACQMKPEKYKSIIIKVIVDKFKLKTSGNMMLFEGWTKILKTQKSIQNRLLDCKIGDNLFIEKFLPIQMFTKPSPRFNEASLVRELEKKGIGRPSTYANIITRIKDKGYLKVEKNKFYATKIGAILITQLKKCFTDLVDYDFTARMEQKLDQISDNKISWKKVLDMFFKNFLKQFEQAKKPPENGGMANNITILTNINCDNCNKKMGIKTAITGVFLSCSGYNLKSEERCKHTINLISLNDFNLAKKNDCFKKEPKRKCEKCNLIMDDYLINENLKIYICCNSPICTIYYIEKGKFESFFNSSKKLYCEKCQNNMLLKIGKFGKFFMCVNKTCKNTRKILPNGEISKPKLAPIPFPNILCTKSDAWFVLREGISGIFFAAHTFPRSKETRSPYVEELFQFKHLLPERLHYLADAPKIDEEGNKAIVCFDKLNKRQYVASKKENKFTDPKKMQLFLTSIGAKNFAADQIMKWIYNHNCYDFNKMLNISKNIRKKLNQIAYIKISNFSEEKVSSDGTKKWITSLNEQKIETVYIPEKKRSTLCISSQIGCALKCDFCATGKQGFNRNLTTSEIISQILQAKKKLKDKKLTNIVFMGMGEPLLNLNNVIAALKIILNKNGFGLSKRRITLSTSGIIPAIDKLSQKVDVNLAISLHASNNDIRNLIMPINKKYNIELLLNSVSRYLKNSNANRNGVTIEYN
ncbi:DNA topoisomerase 3-alpha [Aphis craccivora]|uniref:DNA topoisomerase 3-alpha n=1 Tax=Aphis craccivora TaxID=307492 RepID=A0A6G0XLB5_APHCR|nr:DNA topoisomerase 3-alpha [Aphis craccivora]